MKEERRLTKGRVSPIDGDTLGEIRKATETAVHISLDDDDDSLNCSS